MSRGVSEDRIRGGWWEEQYRKSPEFEIPWEAGRPSPELVSLVEKREIKRGRALDLGCGMGTNALFLAYQGFQVWGIDISRTALRRAKLRARQGGARVAWLEGDARVLPFPSASLDFVYDRGCLHSLDGNDRFDYAREVARVLRPQGQFQLLVFTHRLSLGELDGLFREDFQLTRRDRVSVRERSGNRYELHSLFMQRKTEATVVSANRRPAGAKRVNLRQSP